MIERLWCHACEQTLDVPWEYWWETEATLRALHFNLCAANNRWAA